MDVQFLFLFFWLNLHALMANGQVTEECMIPGHEHNASTLEPPYTVTSNASTYTDGQVITVTLQANETGFRGFLLQARDETGPVGTFIVMGSNAQLLNCGTNDSAVGNNTDDVKSNIVVQWKAPNSTNKDIQFRATFVQNSSIFWAGVQSGPVRFLPTNTPNVTVFPPNGTVFPPNGTVFPPNGTVFPPNGTVFPPNGTVFPPNGTVTTPKGTITTPSKTTGNSPTISLTWCLFLLPLLAII